MGGTVLVTVGSTLFDALIRAVDSLEVADVLKARGYSKIIIQLGNGSHLPSTLLPSCDGMAVNGSGKADNGLEVEWFRFTPNLAKFITTAALVISHAGSASTFETLTAGKCLVSVPNPKLMANHQQELAKELAVQQFCIFSTPDDLPNTLLTMDLESLRPYTGGDPSQVAKAVDQAVTSALRCRGVSLKVKRLALAMLGISLVLSFLMWMRRISEA